jgi:hypothetical protein
MIVQVAADNALAADTVNALVERTSGVPLFVEELTRAVIESSNAKASERAIPVTLHDSLMAGWIGWARRRTSYKSAR